MKNLKLAFFIIGIQTSALPVQMAAKEPRIGWKIFLYALALSNYAGCCFFHHMNFTTRDPR